MSDIVSNFEYQLEISIIVLKTYNPKDFMSDMKMTREKNLTQLPSFA